MNQSVVICQICGHENPSTASLCIRCSSVLEPATKQIDPPQELHVETRWGRKSTGKKLLLHIHGSSDAVRVDLENDLDMIIGRYDMAAQQAPAIDLTSYGAADKGVSRQHAQLTYNNNVLRITDLDSANFSYLNNQKLIPHQARIVRDGDELRLARMVMTIQFGERGDTDDL